MSKKQGKLFVAFISVIFIIFLIVSFNIHKFKKVNLETMSENKDIVVKFETANDYINGYIYDDSQGEMFSNWIMGVGYSYYSNFYFFENCDGKINYLTTYSSYNSLIFSDYIENYDVTALDFVAEKNNKGCKLGVVIIDMKDNESYRYLNEVNINE
jgi:hypothetical protein